MGAVVEPSLEALIAKARAGDAAAFGAVYDRTAGDVLRFLFGLRLGLPAADLEDAVHEAFLRLHRQLDRFEKGRRLRPWLLGIARNVALDLCRRARPNAGSDVDRLTESDHVARDVEAAEEHDLVAEALSALKPQHRTLLALRHISGLTMQELADAEGCSVPTARNRLRDAARLLEGELRQRGIRQETEDGGRP